MLDFGQAESQKRKQTNLSEEEVSPTGDSLRQPEQVPASEINDMEKRLADLENKIAADGLGWESEYRQKLLKEVDQRIALRWAALVIAVCVLVVMFLFALCGFQVVSDFETGNAGLAALKVGLFVAPIASITAIAVMVLIGASKRHSDEGEKIDIPTLFVEAIKAWKGQS